MRKNKLLISLSFYYLSSAIAATPSFAPPKQEALPLSPIANKFTQQLAPKKPQGNSLENLLTSVSVSQGIKYFVANDNTPQSSHYNVHSQPYGRHDPAPDFLNPAFRGWLSVDSPKDHWASTPVVTGSAIGMAAQYFLEHETNLDSVFVVPLVGEDNYGVQLMTRF